MACALHPHLLPSMNYFYIGCQPRKCMNLDARRSLLPASPPPSPPPPRLWFPSPSEASISSWEPSQAACKVWAGGTRGTVLSVSNRNPPPREPWILPAIVLSFPSSVLRWAAVRVTQWPADLREKTDVPINFCQNVITSGLENHMGVGRERNRCITFKNAIIILQKFK